MNTRLSTPPNPPLRAFRSLGERGRGGPGRSIVIDEGGAGVEKEVVQSFPGGPVRPTSSIEAVISSNQRSLTCGVIPNQGWWRRR